jgi:hypothetical protein
MTLRPLVGKSLSPQGNARLTQAVERPTTLTETIYTNSTFCERRQIGYNIFVDSPSLVLSRITALPESKASHPEWRILETSYFINNM